VGRLVVDVAVDVDAAVVGCRVLDAMKGRDLRSC
jgi:hypothetical protein